MSMSFTWGTGAGSYESRPSANLARSSIDDEVRQWSRGIREFMSEEHNFGPYTDRDDGSHIQGKVKVLVNDDATAEAALSNEQEGSLFLLDDGSGNLTLRLFASSAWQDAASLDHGDLSGLTVGHDHTDLLLNIATESPDRSDYDLELNANDLITQEETEQTHGGMTLYRHRSKYHRMLGAVASIDDASITGPHLWLTSYSYVLTLPALTQGAIGMGGFKMFLPNIYCAVGKADIQLQAYPKTASGTGFGIANTSILSRVVGVRGKVLL